MPARNPPWNIGSHMVGIKKGQAEGVLNSGGGGGVVVRGLQGHCCQGYNNNEHLPFIEHQLVPGVVLGIFIHYAFNPENNPRR